MNVGLVSPQLLSMVTWVTTLGTGLTIALGPAASTAWAERPMAPSYADQCPIEGTWTYRAASGYAYQQRTGQYVPAGGPYEVQVTLTESDPRQEVVRDGDTERSVRIAVVKLSNPDPEVRDRDRIMQTGMRVGRDRSGFLMAVPVKDSVAVGAVLSPVTINNDCSKIEGQATVAGTAQVAFTMTREVAPTTGGLTLSLTGEWVVQYPFSAWYIDNWKHAGSQIQQQIVEGEPGANRQPRQATVNLSGRQIELTHADGSKQSGTISQDGQRIELNVEGGTAVLVRIGSANCPRQRNYSETVRTCKI